jgi:hypothetical protein
VWRGRQLRGELRKQLKSAVGVERFRQYVTDRLKSKEFRARRRDGDTGKTKALGVRCSVQADRMVNQWMDDDVIMRLLKGRNFLPAVIGKMKMIADVFAMAGRVGFETWGEDGRCRLCGKEGSRETVEHVMWECQHHRIQKQREAAVQEIEELIEETGMGRRYWDRIGVAWTCHEYSSEQIWEWVTSIKGEEYYGEDAEGMRVMVEQLMTTFRSPMAVTMLRKGIVGEGWINMAEGGGLSREQAVMLGCEIGEVVTSEEGGMRLMRMFQNEVYRNGKSEEEERERGDSLQDDMEEFLYQLEQGGAREEGWNKVRLWKPDRRDRWVQTVKEKMEVGMELRKAAIVAWKEGLEGVRARTKMKELKKIEERELGGQPRITCYFRPDKESRVQEMEEGVGRTM